ncbi:MAG: multiubiquitin domain-containing protein [Chitinophagaceae bacterium]|nr:multiubiquitin domain-containing protein [Chitinophagaceae bacterium]
MSNLKENEQAEVKIIDIELYTREGKVPAIGKRYKVKVDNEPYIFDYHEVTGDEILMKASKLPIECHSLFIKLKGCEFELIRPHQKVDLTSGGTEHFVTKPPVVFHYTVDKEPETTEEAEMTPNQILAAAGIEPVKDYYLVQLDPDGTQHSYKGHGNDPIRMKCPALHFVSVFNGETPVS